MGFAVTDGNYDVTIHNFTVDFQGFDTSAAGSALIGEADTVPVPPKDTIKCSPPNRRERRGRAPDRPNEA
jgi:hypothetical protein